MVDTGWKAISTVVSETVSGATVWTNSGDAGDGVYYGTYSTAVDVAKDGGLTDRLKATGFGFSIPDGSTILGVEVRYRWWAEGTSDDGPRDNSVRLVVSGSLAGDDKATGTQLAYETNQSRTYGGAADVWGNSLTTAIVNASNFGVALQMRNDNSLNNRDIRVYTIEIRVTYEEPEVGNTGAFFSFF
ncbi:hypothetical protein [Nitratireductor indicus]|uniref:hypothetical protein n=1 Tax=Nitratireductor indicus TaxID=721133 RepID=UPI0008E46AD9|nr:hypothetical protein [Nitratireductor indicus]SFQ82322.1 hypothetical protein SAMN05216176_1313 [Nitratireductor indicus]